MTELSSAMLLLSNLSFPCIPFLPLLLRGGVVWTLPISFLGWVASAQLQELSLSSQGRLWFPTTCQPAYFMLWVQPHHGRSNGNERLRVIALRAIIRHRSGTLRRPLCDCGYYPVKRIWDPASVKKEETGRQAKLSFSSQVCTANLP
jgi:hypothetical protein